MTFLLAGDIGGTKTILQLVRVRDEGTESQRALPQYETCYTQRYPSNDFPDLVPMVEQFLSEIARELEITSRPQKACFAIAGPVVRGSVKLTNLSWPTLAEQRLREALDMVSVRLINDFLAIGYGVLGLKADDLHTLQPAESQENAPIAVIGAGTGLGEAFLAPAAAGYQVYPSEGGHTDFSPRSELEFALLQYLRDQYKIARVSTERVVSGQGIVAIYQFLRDRQIAKESDDVAAVVRTWEREAGQSEKSVDPAATIATAALEQQDHLCEQTMQIFVEAYGAEAGNLALKLLPYAGLYIAGGIAAKNISLLETGGFMQNFRDKGRVSAVLEKVPVHVILNPQVGLIGAALFAAQS